MSQSKTMADEDGGDHDGLTNDDGVHVPLFCCKEAQVMLCHDQIISVVVGNIHHYLRHRQMM